AVAVAVGITLGFVTPAGAQEAAVVFSRMMPGWLPGIGRSDTVARFSDYELVNLQPFVINEEQLA
ncbi:MAG: hypothetical protein LPH21_17710, partial [Shewanella sp.]|nr:hypothetical protein [Shewanella sp.]